ncbi:hypothetical protein [Caldanaerobacter subterraneus]|uniref:hypothetical protein n=1 Tax=Caldanaerobacter subterraneus TaxID=911092 RepID=UPI001F0D40DC|nr:hypothetical protein [Caldanaerobacter subterraneus]
MKRERDGNSIFRNLGNKKVPIMRDTTPIKDADYVLCESTYGNRIHKDVEDRAKKLMEIITCTIKIGGSLYSFYGVFFFNVFAIILQVVNMSIPIHGPISIKFLTKNSENCRI